MLQLLWTRTLPPTLKARFDLALHAFFVFGTLGLRGTRGLGALHCAASPDVDSLQSQLESKGITIRWRESPAVFGTYDAALKDYASWLRYVFRKERKATNPSPLGSSSPRQSNAVRFRPVKIVESRFTWLAYEAPHARVLGGKSRTPTPFLQARNFSGAAPDAS